jgi:hypothetical protein
VTAVLLAAVLSGCPKQHPAVTASPPTALSLSWLSFGELAIRWTPPSEAVDVYQVEGRIGAGAFQLITGNAPGNAIGMRVRLNPVVPELVEAGIRVRSVRGGVTSDYTPEATLLRGVRPPSALAVHTQDEDVALSWTQGSAVAEQVRVERSARDVEWAEFGPYEVVTTLPATVTSWIDRSAPLGAQSRYRLANVASYHGARLRSDATEGWADRSTSFVAPANLQATVILDGVRLTWTAASRHADSQAVERCDATQTTMCATIATVGAATSTFLDRAPAPGGYRYRITAHVFQPGAWLKSSGEVVAFVAPPPGRWGLTQELMHMPAVDGVARDDGGGWWFARRWRLDSFAGSTVWSPAGAGWDVHEVGSAATGLFEPGIALDAPGDAHVLWLEDIDPAGGTAPLLRVRHSWKTGPAWHDEAIADRSVERHSGAEAQFGVDAAGAVHALWRASETVGGSVRRFFEYATNAGGTWSVVELPFTDVVAGNALAFRLAVAPDGSVHALVLGSLAPSAQAGLVHAWKPAGGAWAQEVVYPAGALSYEDVAPFAAVAHGAEDVDLLFSHDAGALMPSEYRFQARTAAGWGAAEVLALGSVSPMLAVSRDGARRAALLYVDLGIRLATWQADTGWTTELIRRAVPPSGSWLGFDATGALDILLPGTVVGPDGMTDRIHLRSTR